MKVDTLKELERCLASGTSAQINDVFLGDDDAAAAVPILERCGGEQLPNLRRLVLVDAQLEALPGNLGSFETLESLVVWRNRLTTLPASVASLTRLGRIHLASNAFDAIPDVLADVPCVDIDLHDNPLACLSRRPMPTLTQLDVRGCGLTELGPELRLLPALEELVASSNRIAFVAPEVGTLSCLNSLDVSDNALRTLPDELGALPIERMSAWGNPFDGFPRVLLQLSGLRALSMSDCGLQEVPPELGAFEALEMLDLSQNRIAAFPRTLRELSQLTWLNLEGNPALPEMSDEMQCDEPASVLLQL